VADEVRKHFFKSPGVPLPIFSLPKPFQNSVLRNGAILSVARSILAPPVGADQDFGPCNHIVLASRVCIPPWDQPLWGQPLVNQVRFHQLAQHSPAHHFDFCRNVEDPLRHDVRVRLNDRQFALFWRFHIHTDRTVYR